MKVNITKTELPISGRMIITKKFIKQIFAKDERRAVFYGSNEKIFSKITKKESVIKIVTKLVKANFSMMYLKEIHYKTIKLES